MSSIKYWCGWINIWSVYVHFNEFRIYEHIWYENYDFMSQKWEKINQKFVLLHDIDIFINDKWRKYAGGDIGWLFKITRRLELRFWPRRKRSQSSQGDFFALQREPWFNAWVISLLTVNYNGKAFFFFRNEPIRNKNCLWRPCLSMDRDEMSNLYRGPSIDASYQVSVHLAKPFRRRTFSKIGKSETIISCGGHDC